MRQRRPPGPAAGEDHIARIGCESAERCGELRERGLDLRFPGVLRGEAREPIDDRHHVILDLVPVDRFEAQQRAVPQVLEHASLSSLRGRGLIDVDGAREQSIRQRLDVRELGLASLEHIDPRSRESLDPRPEDPCG